MKTVQVTFACPTCKGSGYIESHHANCQINSGNPCRCKGKAYCPDCKGSGEVVKPIHVGGYLNAEESAEMVELIAKLTGPTPINQDEMGGCVHCGKGHGDCHGYATSSVLDHEEDCDWLAGRKFLAKLAGIDLPDETKVTT